MHEVSGIPLYHLDMMYWNADRTTVPREVFQEKLEAALRQACDTVFFLDYPVEVCLEGVNSRKGIKRTDLPWVEGAGELIEEEFLKFIRDFREESRPRILELLKKYAYKQIYVFKNREEAASFWEK